MVVVTEVRTTEVLQYRGVHVFHAWTSTCSQRVRLCLAEKRIPHESHPLSLAKLQHVTEWFFGVNPAGKVPVLVHDGVVHRESIDIVAYLDRTFPHPSLTPRGEEDSRMMRAWVKLAASAQRPILYLTHHFGLGWFGRRSEAAVAAMAALDSGLEEDTISAFHRRARGGFSPELLRAQISFLQDVLGQLEEQLSVSDESGEPLWLAGSGFSQADVCWFPIVHRLSVLCFPLAPRLRAWADRVRARPSFAEAMPQRQLRVSESGMRLRCSVLRFFGMGVESYVDEEARARRWRLAALVGGVFTILVGMWIALLVRVADQ